MAEKPSAAAGIAVGPIRVALADDDVEVVSVLTALVRAEEELELVGTASDGEAAIELAISEEPDVVLLDVRMPGGGGLRAAREIARRCPKTRIIALSAHEDEVTVIQMMGAGADAYVPKGASTDRILREIYRQVDSGPSSELSTNVWGGPDRDELAPRRDARRERILDVIEHDAISVSLRPIFDIASGAFVGAEALPRVARIPVRGADAWLAEAESVDLLAELERAILDTAVRSLNDLPSEAFVVIGLSSNSLAEPRLRAAFAPEDIPRVVLQLTEHAHVSDYETLKAALGGLRELGVRVAVGDVGAGVANLRHVVNIAPDLLTIDASLTRGVEIDSARHAVVAAITSCAEQLGARVIATGVASMEQLDELTRLGVHLFQSRLQVEPTEVRNLTWEVALNAQVGPEPNVQQIGPAIVRTGVRRRT